jgi:arginyl-tRNA synthetase
MEALKEESARLIRDLAERLFGAAPDKVVVEYPPRPDMGDLASPVAFELARRLKRPPREIAQQLAEALPRPEWLARVEAGGAGYLNLYVDRAAALRALALEVRTPPPAAARPESIIVEHTNINPNKAAHIGHLRNAVLGDSLARMLRFLGHKVEVQNYIDDTGVQVADVLIGFREILGWGIAEAQAVREPIDRFCWDLYSRVTALYDAEPAKRSMQAAMLKELEERRGATGAFADWLTRAIVGCHLDTMRRIGVRYDLLPWEGDILALKFWETAFDLLKASGAIVQVASGERAGCWVMALESDRFAELKEAEKIIVRSNGTVTYVGKDIAYQMWKFGLLPRDFHYDLFREEESHRVWTTSRVPGRADHPAFGRADRVYNVIDVRQSYLQAIVAEGLRALGHESQASLSVHFAYEMVALTPKSAERLGVTLSEEDRARPYVGMSGRRGLGVKADDLLDALEAEALREVRARHIALADAEATSLARAIAVGALRYFMIKFTRNKVLAFDFDEALSFEGETGPYLQYAAVRARGIFEKMAAQGGPTEADAAAWAAEATFDLPAGPDAEEHWALASQIARFRDTVAQSVGGLELSLVAKYGFALAQRFNTFYHRYPVMKEPDERWQRARIVLTWLFIAQMRRVLDLMGIPLPDRM